MKTTLVLLSLGLSATVNTASADCIKGVGEVVRKPLSVDAFHGISLEGSMDVVRAIKRSCNPWFWQAARISGVTPAALSALLGYVKKAKRSGVEAAE